MALDQHRFVWLCCLAVCLSFIEGASSSCSTVKTAYTLKAFQGSDVPSQPSSGSALKVCSTSNGCCSKKMEDNFVGLSRTDFETALKASTNDMKTIFANNAKVFDVFFRALIKNSETELNKLYIKTYGVFYEKHSKVFADLFQELNRYYDGKSLDLSQVMNNFFSNLMRQMFQLMNTKYAFTKSFLDCVTEYMDDLKPFGEAKKTLSVQLKRALVTARTFSQSLAVGHSVVKQIQSLSASKDCQAEITKMMYCSWCKGKTDMKPCSALCTDTYKSCLVDLRDLSTPWDNYITTLLEATNQLEGPFSIENIVVPIGVKISFAIMNYQESNTAVSKKIFGGCGTPDLSKSRRSTDGDFFLEGSDRKRRGAKKGKASNDYPKDSPDVSPTTAAGTSLGRLTRSFKAQVMGSKGFWDRRASPICSGPMMSSDPNKCWNGTAFGKYTSPGNSNNNVDSITPSSTIVQQQIVILKTMTQRLKAALEGEEVVGGGDNEGSASASGSGSGEGSGNEIDEGKSTVKPTTNENEVDDENMLGGGANNGNTLGKKDGRSAGSTVTASGLIAGLLLCVAYNVRW